MRHKSQRILPCRGISSCNVIAQHQILPLLQTTTYLCKNETKHWCNRTFERRNNFTLLWRKCCFTEVNIFLNFLANKNSFKSLINDIIEFYSLLEAYFATEKRDSHLFIFLTNATWNNVTNTTYSGQARKIGGLCSTDRFNRCFNSLFVKNE